MSIQRSHMDLLKFILSLNSLRNYVIFLESVVSNNALYYSMALITTDLAASTPFLYLFSL